MTGSSDAGLDAQITQWRGDLQRRRALSPSDTDELEDHLRNQVSDLQNAGLHDDEAFLVAVIRLGSLDQVSREFALEHSERLWKQLVLGPDSSAGSADASRSRRELSIVLGLGAAAALAVKAPAWAGMSLNANGDFYARNVSLFVLPFLAGYFTWKRSLPLRRAALLLLPPFAFAAALASRYAFDDGRVTEVLFAIHLPILLWFTVGVAYVGGDWRAHRRRMDFVRFTGEWAVYYTLLALGGAMLVGLTAAGFEAIGRDATVVMQEWVLPCGAVGAVLVAAWLVEAKQAVVENIAPVLTRVFTPLTVIMLVAFLVATLVTLVTDGVVQVDRNLLILVDLILVLVLGLLLYAISARDPDVPPGTFDRLQLLMVCCALLLDMLMLAAMIGRTAEFGVSANKAAALGLNIVLLVNLGWAARLSIGFLRRRRPLHDLEHWQTGYLPILAGWAAVVATAFPPLFRFA